MLTFDEVCNLLPDESDDETESSSEDSCDSDDSRDSEDEFNTTFNILCDIRDEVNCVKRFKSSNSPPAPQPSPAIHISVPVPVPPTEFIEISDIINFLPLASTSFPLALASAHVTKPTQQLLHPPVVPTLPSATCSYFTSTYIFSDAFSSICTSSCSHAYQQPATTSWYSVLAARPGVVHINHPFLMHANNIVVNINNKLVMTLMKQIIIRCIKIN
jgi:hypothetical protein